MTASHDPKIAQRGLAARRRDSLDVALRATKSQEIVAHIATYLQQNKTAVHLALYASMRSEVDICGLPAACVTLGYTFSYPRVEAQAAPLVFVPVDEHTSWCRTSAGFLQPSGAAIDRSCISLVLVPGLAFDSLGYRLGYGAGYYDRTLSTMSATTLGVAFAIQRVHRLPVAAHDVAVHAIVDEYGLSVVGGSSSPFHGKQQTTHA